MNKKFTDISSVCVLILYLFLVARMFRNNIPLYILVLFFSVINITIVLSGHELGHLFFGKIFGFKLSSISFCGAEYNGYLKKWSYDFKQRKENHCLMNPKSDSSNTHIYLYLLGGIISNILLIIICILLFLKNTNLILRAFLFNNIFINTVNLINTVFPVRDVEFLSDSDIIWYIHKEKIQLEFLKKQLKISHSIEFNKTIGESSYINMENVKYENMLTFFCRYSNYYLAIKNNDLTAVGTMQDTSYPKYQTMELSAPVLTAAHGFLDLFFNIVIAVFDILLGSVTGQVQYRCLSPHVPSSLKGRIVSII